MKKVFILVVAIDLRWYIPSFSPEGAGCLGEVGTSAKIIIMSKFILTHLLNDETI